MAVDKMGSITLIAINRPEKRNAVDRSTAKELCQAVELFENDSTSKAAVLYGKGQYSVSYTSFICQVVLSVFYKHMVAMSITKVEWTHFH